MLGPPRDAATIERNSDEARVKAGTPVTPHLTLQLPDACRVTNADRPVMPGAAASVVRRHQQSARNCRLFVRQRTTGADVHLQPRTVGQTVSVSMPRMNNPAGGGDSPRISFRLSLNELTQLDRMAERTGLPRSALLRQGARAVLAIPGPWSFDSSPREYGEALFAAQEAATTAAALAVLANMPGANEDEEEEDE